MRFTVAVVLALALAGCALGDMCLNVQTAVGAGKACDAAGSSIYCTQDSFCATRTGVCTTKLTAGSSCELEGGACALGTRCQGTNDNRKCVTVASPGEDCGTDAGKSVPFCGTGDSNCVNNLCIGGVIGDRCYRNSDCVSNSCVADANSNPVTMSCAALPDGSNCTLSYGICGFGSFCNMTTFPGKCTSRSADGGSCVTLPCMPNSHCLSTSQICIAPSSQAVGMPCDSSADCDKSTSMRCYAGTCQAKRLTFCTSSSQCSYDETCSCGGDVATGFGVCAPNKCYNSYLNYRTCAATKCSTTVGAIPSYAGSCLVRNCQNELNAFKECSPASKILGSALLVAVVAVFASWLGH